MPSSTNPIRKEKRREMLKEKKQRNFLSSLTDAVLDCMVTQTSKTLTTNMNNRTVFSAARLVQITSLSR
jgi:hypothetical protein